ncbi:MAG TPA: helix-turn-helix domain-containing protein [Ignavibacteria bacterium]|nr:helix-turn-helix domain-containing protein [Ignavibacteria bacterium]
MTSKKNNLNEELKKIFAFESQDEKDEFQADILHMDLIHQIYLRMKFLGLSKADLAKELKTSKSFITQLFSGDKHLNLKLIAKLSRILGLKLNTEFINTNSYTDIIYNSENNIYSIDKLDGISDNFEKIDLPKNFKFEDNLYGKVD